MDNVDKIDFSGLFDEKNVDGDQPAGDVALACEAISNSHDDESVSIGNSGLELVKYNPVTEDISFYFI